MSAVWATVNDNGDLVIPAELATQFGLTPGARLRLEAEHNTLRLHRPVTHLTKVYVEPTTACNIDCITCFRNDWDEPIGHMTETTFQRILAGLDDFAPCPTVYFGGIGEPLFNRHTVEWVAQASAKGSRTELITNGTMLTEKTSRALIAAGLDVLWISIDGATPESYADVRLGAQLPHVLENLATFHRARRPGHAPKPELGIAFVAMERNFKDLPEILRMLRKYKVRHVSVSNLLPITEKMQSEQLYVKALRNTAYFPSAFVPTLSLPKMDFNAKTRDTLFKLFDAGYNVSYAGNNWGGANDVCNFIEDGTISFSWKGDASPCWPQLHTHTSYLHGKPHINYKHLLGNIHERSLSDLWFDEEYVAYRTRVQNFDFPPCTFCGGCEMSEDNLTDCIGNPFPACGACVWSQGAVQCP